MPLSALLTSLVIVLLVVPVAETLPYTDWLLRIGITAVLISAAVATTRRRALLWTGIIVASIATPLSWATLFIDQPYLFLGTCALESLFFAAMAVLIIVSVIRKHLATIQSVVGAIAAYLLLGLAWALLYWGMNNMDAGTLLSKSLDASAGRNESADEVIQFSKCIYFSFVTMSTLGFGDITPTTPIMQTLTWMQSVVGQFYMAVLVAWLVSEIPGKRRSPFELPAPDERVTSHSDTPQGADGDSELARIAP